MSKSGAYASWAAVSSAIKDAASKGAKSGGPDVNAQIVSARVDRFLSRVFADREESGWLLKGGTSMLARVPRTRAMKGMQDLVASADPAEISRITEQIRQMVSSREFKRFAAQQRRAPR